MKKSTEKKLAVISLVLVIGTLVGYKDIWSQLKIKSICNKIDQNIQEQKDVSNARAAAHDSLAQEWFDLNLYMSEHPIADQKKRKEMLLRAYRRNNAARDSVDSVADARLREINHRLDSLVLEKMQRENQR